jgi:lactoylglutathione lyase
MSVLHYSHLGQSVRDLERSVRFYTGLLGFTEVARFEVGSPESAKLLRLPEPVELTACYLRRDAIVLELLHFRSPSPRDAAAPRVVNDVGITHLSFVVDDVEAVVARVVSFGGRVREDTRLASAVFIEDPDGQMIELLSPDTGLRRLLWPDKLA